MATTRRSFILGTAAFLLADATAARSQPVITVDTVEAFVQAIGPDRTIQLKPGTYTLSDLNPDIRSPHAYFTSVTDGYQLMVTGADNLTILGAGKLEARIFTKPRWADVIAFENCRNISIRNVVIGHSPVPAFCAGDVLKFYRCRSVSIDRCDLFGSGVTGIRASNLTDLVCTQTIVRECSANALSFYDSQNLLFKNCQFLNNRGSVSLSTYRTVKFLRCEFSGNGANKPTAELPGSAPIDFLFKLNGGVPVEITECKFKDNIAFFFAASALDIKLVKPQFINNLFKGGQLYPIVRSADDCSSTPGTSCFWVK